MIIYNIPAACTLMKGINVLRDYPLQQPRAFHDGKRHVRFVGRYTCGKIMKHERKFPDTRRIVPESINMGVY
jgi:hypothetical protein